MDLSEKKSDPVKTPLELYGDIPRITRIFRNFIYAYLTAILVGIAILVLAKNYWQAVFLGGMLPLVALSLFFVRRSKFEAVAAFLSIISISAITLMSTTGQGIHHIANLGYPALLVVASLVTRRRTLVLLTLYAIACVAWLVFGEIYGLYSPNMMIQSIATDFISAALIILVTAVMVRLITETLFEKSKELETELQHSKRMEGQLAHDALHDALTGLPNRTLLFDRLNQRLEHARRHPNNLFAILYIDLDRFKVLNDSLGHAVGDQLLVTTAQRLKQCLREEDTISRLSGDEFAILVNDFKEINEVFRIADRIEEKLSSSPMVEITNRETTASIGITVFNGRYVKAEEMLRDADTAMYRAKAMGGGHYKLFDDTMYASAMFLLRLESDLKHGVEHREFRVYYQPIVSMPGRKIIGLEALVRWKHPQRGLIPPAEFIEVAEESGLILPIGDHVLVEACRHIKTWREKKNPHLFVSVNLSGRQFHHQNLLKKIEAILAEYELPGEALKLEITESVAMRDHIYSTWVLKELNRMGIEVILDDFGTGYSSLDYINRFPIKTLKIDRSFIKDIEKNSNNQTITTAILSISKTLDLDVIAEGVEKEKQLEFLESISCHKFQGYLFHRVMPPKTMEKKL